MTWEGHAFRRWHTPVVFVGKRQETMERDPKAGTASLLDSHMPIAEFIAFLGIDRKTADSMEKRGEGPARIKVAGRVYYPRDRVADWLRSLEDGPVNPGTRRGGRVRARRGAGR